MSLATSELSVDRKPRSRKMRKEELAPAMNRLGAIILSGGEGSRLFPLTLSRCKPAISFAGRYRLIDVPISNSINSGCNKIFIITQFLSTSLHQHIFRTYRNDIFNGGFIELLSAEQKPSKHAWFKGTADAVRQNLEYLVELPVDYFLILSGDQLYSMDYQEMLNTAKRTNADVVLAALPIKETECKRMGILKIDSQDKITNFVEKTHDSEVLKQMQMTEEQRKELKCADSKHLGSMGIYLFKREFLFKLLLEDLREDFGKHLIPALVEKGKVTAHLFNGYWEDIGTIESFYQANMALTSPNPPFDCYDQCRPIYSSHYNLAGSRISNSLINNSIICEGCVVEAEEIRNSILGPRTVVKKGSVITQTYVMGNDYYEPLIHTETLPEYLEIGKHCILSKAIIDKNVCIGDNVRLINKNGLKHYDGNNFYVRDGIIIVPRGATLPDGFIF